MRYYTYSVGAFLVGELDIAGAVDKIIHDGRDIIHLRLISGEHLMIHLIDSPIPLYEINNTLTKNTAEGYHTLFILWSDMLLPDHGRRVLLEDWHRALLALYDDKIYAYKIYMQRLYVFPVHFDAGNYTQYHTVRYGEALDVGGLRCYQAEVNMAGLTGTYRVTAFDGDPDAYHRERARKLDDAPDDLARYFAVLEVAPSADRATIKTAFREKARQYHPDLNGDDPDAHDKMQALNRAYEMILKARDDV
jgi:hypothetical protein